MSNQIQSLLYEKMLSNDEMLMSSLYEDVFSSDYDWLGTILDQAEDVYLRNDLYYDLCYDQLIDCDDMDKLVELDDKIHSLMMYYEHRIRLLKEKLD